MSVGEMLLMFASALALICIVARMLDNRDTRRADHGRKVRDYMDRHTSEELRDKAALWAQAAVQAHENQAMAAVAGDKADAHGYYVTAQAASKQAGALYDLAHRKDEADPAHSHWAAPAPTKARQDMSPAEIIAARKAGWTDGGDPQ